MYVINKIKMCNSRTGEVYRKNRKSKFSFVFYLSILGKFTASCKILDLKQKNRTIRDI